MRMRLYTLLFAGLLAFSGNAGFGQSVYWIDADFVAPKLGKAELVGTNPVTISLNSHSLPQGLALDVVNSKLCFGELNFSTAKLQWSFTSLAGLAALDSTGSAMRGMTVDAAGAKMYWTNSNLSTGSKIVQANVDGSNKLVLYSFTAASGTNLRGIAISGTTLYWADFHLGKIQTGSTSGGSSSDLIAGLNGPVGVALGNDGYIYWTEANSNTIKRRLLSGGSIEVLLSGLSKPNYLAIDPGAAMMYWTEIGVPSIKKASLTGASMVVLPVTVTHPTGIAVTSTPLPVQLSSFRSTIVNSGSAVRLDWTTISETNNYGFFVERKLESENSFTTIPGSFMAGHGTTLDPHQYSYTDYSVPQAHILYRLRQVDLDGTNHLAEPITVDLLTQVREHIPVTFELLQNYPNPFNPSTEIKFSVEATDHATLEVYNPLGQKVATLFNGIAESGHYYKVRFDGGNLSSGMYFYRLESGMKNDLKKLILLK